MEVVKFADKKSMLINETFLPSSWEIGHQIHQAGKVSNYLKMKTKVVQLNATVCQNR